MSRRALLYRRPSEPSVVPVIFDRATYLVRLRRHRQARRYTLRIDAAGRKPVANAEIMRRALQYAGMFDRPIFNLPLVPEL